MNYTLISTTLNISYYPKNRTIIITFSTMVDEVNVPILNISTQDQKLQEEEEESSLSLSIEEITKKALSEPPHFAFRYNQHTMDFYFRLEKAKTINALVSHLQNYNNMHSVNDIIEEQINNDSSIDIKNIKQLIKNDFRCLMIDSIIEAFYHPVNIISDDNCTDKSIKYSNSDDSNICIDTGIMSNITLQEAKNIIVPVIKTQLDSLVFKRTSNYNTRFGFM